MVDEGRAAAAAMNAVVQLLRPLPVGQKGPGRRRRWQQAIAYLRELAAPPWVTDAHFHPLATACASEEEVLELLTQHTVQAAKEGEIGTRELATVAYGVTLSRMRGSVCALFAALARAA